VTIEVREARSDVDVEAWRRVRITLNARLGFVPGATSITVRASLPIPGLTSEAVSR
jgi:hypothetical protein